MSFESVLDRARAWCAADPDPETKAELIALIERCAEEDLAERFAGRLTFGTAGIRGVLGAGPNRMNRAVVRQTTAGLARYLLAVEPAAQARGVVVGRDGRRMSDAFSDDAAGVLAAHGIHVKVFREPVPTPLVAFATVREGASAGVMITASHNPPEYNGYKVYWANGAQIIPPHDAGIAREIEGVGPADAIHLLAVETARARGLFRDLGEEIARAYLDALSSLRLHAEAGRGLRVVYTALHGVGGVWVEAALAGAGYELRVVPEQQRPDGEFPTVRFPNPEEPGALDLALSLAETEHADVVLANDPDADRFAAAVRDANGRLCVLTGNEIGVLLGHYILTETRPLPPKPLVLTTIVSSAQLREIARSSGALYAETLTGFKWIANRAIELERSQGATFVFGYEEALGYTVGRVVRDKDGIGAAVLFADLAGWCRSRGTSVPAYLARIQREHGLYLATQRSFTFEGAEGAAIISKIMDGFRLKPPDRIGEHDVAAVTDYLDSRSGLPPANVLAYELAGGSRVMLRPSGTEPKIKYYFELRETVTYSLLPLGEGQGEGSLESAKARGEERLGKLVNEFVVLARERGQPS